jgi:hypothetical protein
MSLDKKLWTIDDVKTASQNSKNNFVFFVVCDKVYAMHARDINSNEEIVRTRFAGKDLTIQFLALNYTKDDWEILSYYFIGDIIKSERKSNSKCDGSSSHIPKIIGAGIGIAIGVIGIQHMFWQMIQSTAVTRLLQHTGDGTWVMTPTGRKDALEASAFNIPASILQQGLHCTLEWIWDNKISSIYVGKIRMGRLAQRNTPKQISYMSRPKTRCHLEGLATLSTLRHATRKRIIHFFPKVLEVLLTNPITGRRRNWASVEEMSRFDRSFLGL